MKSYLLVIFVFFTAFCYSQSSNKDTSNSDKILLTIFLKHDQSMNLNEIEEIRTNQGFYEKFPPPGTTIVNWYVVMGIGQMVVLELPASKLKDVNLAIERTAWKAFKTEYYPTYDLYPIVEKRLTNKSKKAY